MHPYSPEDHKESTEGANMYSLPVLYVEMIALRASNKFRGRLFSYVPLVFVGDLKISSSYSTSVEGLLGFVHSTWEAIRLCKTVATLAISL